MVQFPRLGVSYPAEEWVGSTLNVDAEHYELGLIVIWRRSCTLRLRKHY